MANPNIHIFISLQIRLGYQAVPVTLISIKREKKLTQEKSRLLKKKKIEKIFFSGKRNFLEFNIGTGWISDLLKISYVVNLSER